MLMKLSNCEAAIFNFFLMLLEDWVISHIIQIFLYVLGFFHVPVTGAVLYCYFIPFLFVSLFYCLYFMDDENTNEHMMHTVIQDEQIAFSLCQMFME